MPRRRATGLNLTGKTAKRIGFLFKASSVSSQFIMLFSAVSSPRLLFVELVDRQQGPKTLVILTLSMA